MLKIHFCFPKEHDTEGESCRIWGMIPILADRFDPEHAFLGKNAYVCVKFSRFNGIGLRHNGSYDPDIIVI